MSTTMFFQRLYRLCRDNGTYPNAVGALVGASSGSITAWKRGAIPRHSMVKKLADHFGVSTDYLLGYSDDPDAPVQKAGEGIAEPAPAVVSDEELKFALFGGDGEVTDAMLDEVRRFAAFVKYRNTPNRD